MFDVTQIITQIITQILELFSHTSTFVILCAFLFLLVVKSSYFKGKTGEWIMQTRLNRELDEDTYHTLNDVTLICDDGTTQIDHIVVSTYGVFVVETKNYKGWIYGDVNQKKWTQVLYKKKSSFQNPLHQNYKHTQVLQQLLQLEKNQLHSLVVFVGDSTFKTSMPRNVMTYKEVAPYISSFGREVINRSDVLKLVEQIKAGMLKQGIRQDWEHKEHVKQLVKQKEHKQAALKTTEPSTKQDRSKCPLCGELLIKRVAKKGKRTGESFWGCSAYPKCRHTTAIDK